MPFSTLIKRRLKSLDDRELLALAISTEEEDARIYANYADGLREDFPASADLFETMTQEEHGHRQRLLSLYQKLYGIHVIHVRRDDIRGFKTLQPYWLARPLGIEKMRNQVIDMETMARSFYLNAAGYAVNAEVKNLFGQLAEEEVQHRTSAVEIIDDHETKGLYEAEDEVEHRNFLLQIVQPGLAGLMDGSVSTLAPLFAAAFATQNTWETFLVGMAAAIGAGISMGFAEALSDDGELTGRGSPWIRGFSSGIMTAIGGIGHALPYLIPDFWTATIAAIVVVILELWAIAWIRYKFMETPFFSAALQVVLGGALVLAAGVLIGGA